MIFTKFDAPFKVLLLTAACIGYCNHFSIAEAKSSLKGQCEPRSLSDAEEHTGAVAKRYYKDIEYSELLKLARSSDPKTRGGKKKNLSPKEAQARLKELNDYVQKNVMDPYTGKLKKSQEALRRQQSVEDERAKREGKVGRKVKMRDVPSAKVKEKCGEERMKKLQADYQGRWSCQCPVVDEHEKPSVLASKLSQADKDDITGKGKKWGSAWNWKGTGDEEVSGQKFNEGTQKYQLMRTPTNNQYWYRVK